MPLCMLDVFCDGYRDVLPYLCRAAREGLEQLKQEEEMSFLQG